MAEVYIIESERRWGKKTLSTLEFGNRNAAKAFTKGFNSFYNPIDEPTPDYYIYAELEGQSKSFGMLR